MENVEVALSELLPRVKVLLATCNGAAWLREQLDSIALQEHVTVSVTASDDFSLDSTVQLLQGFEKMRIDILPPLGSKLGSAAANFFRLIRDADLGDAQFVAFSDQDDIWLPGKLARAVSCLRAISAQGYSGSVVAFWPDGEKRLIDKAQSQRKYDHLFGSPGPGCSFVLPRSVFDQLREFITENPGRMVGIYMHDWLIYAFVRSRGGRWHIDKTPMILYRQHSRNVLGANVGGQAAAVRAGRIFSGAYRQDVLRIADSLGCSVDVVSWLRDMTVLNRLQLMINARHFRRRLFDRVCLAFCFTVMSRGNQHLIEP